jgi:hypothetical protein
MPRIFYLVAPSVEGGVADAAARGWKQIARTYFVTPEKEAVWLITRYLEIPRQEDFPRPVPMLRGSGYEDGEGLVMEHHLDLWIKDKQRFDEFVESGEGVWLERVGRIHLSP